MTNGSEPAAVQQLIEAAGLHRTAWAERYPGRRAFGYLCSCWPEELSLAAGCEPVRLLPPPRAGAPARLPAYCCTVARGFLELGEAGEYGGLAGVGFAHACDTMQCLGEIWKSSRRGEAFVCVPPVALKNEGALKYYAAELASLLARLGESFSCSPGPEELRSAIALNNRVRSLVGKLDGLRPRLPSHLTFTLMLAGQLMPRVDYAGLLEKALPELAGHAKDPGGRRRVLVSGAVLESDGLYRMLEELGGRVVADDTCTGFRHFAVPVAEEGDPLGALAARLAARPPCPCRHLGLGARADYLVRLASSRQARAAVLVLRKYCEPHAWDSVSLSGALRAAGIAVQVLELEGALPGEQERTRLQAFMEQF